MKDQVFTGRDVPDALAAASRALGLPAGALRYVVLDRGVPGALGMGGTPARVAVLLDTEPAGAPAPERPEEAPIAVGEEEDAAEGLRDVVHALAEAARIDLEVHLEEAAEELHVRLSGPGCEFFFEADGEVLRALDHLLHRMFAHRLEPRRLRLSCEGYREFRDAALRANALALADKVRADGAARETPPLNAYERRIIHLALAEEAGVRTYSVGEEGERRVMIASAAPAPPRPAS